MKAINADILVVGGGLGGVAAALTAARIGCTVVLSEESDWLGGQLTSQAVPMDEHPWMDRFGCTATYRELRARVRAYYKRNYPVSARARTAESFTPGAALTTHLSCEPRVALAVIEEMLAPFISNGLVSPLISFRPERVDKSGDMIRAVEFAGMNDDSTIVVHPRYVLDATEAGEFLPLAGLEYVTGAESAEDTGELHALPGPAEPQNMQAFTYCFAVGYYPGENHTIDKPAEYDFWNSYQAGFETEKHFSLNPRATRAHQYEFFPSDGSGKFSLWQYRRILYAPTFAEGYLPGDVSLINCSHNDYWLGSIVDVSEGERERNLYMARQESLSTLYWMQTEIPRPDGGQGYPGLKVLPSYTGTLDGLAKRPYIREGRRICSHFTVTENHVGLEVLGDAESAVRFDDSVGIGCYNIDLHPTTGGQSSLNLKTKPFQIPLGALLPRDCDNVIAAAKNIGVTHLTNGCFRLHSTEWNIGEAAGALAASCLTWKCSPVEIREKPDLLQDYQRNLDRLGVERSWPDLSIGTSYYSHARDQGDWDWGEYDRRPHWSF